MKDNMNDQKPRAHKINKLIKMPETAIALPDGRAILITKWRPTADTKGFVRIEMEGIIVEESD